MPFDAHKNFAYTTVAVAPSPATSGLSLTVATGKGALFPAPPFNASVWPVNTIPLQSTAEIVRVTNIVGDVLTISRAQEDTTARTILVGDAIALTHTAKNQTDVENAIATAGMSIIEVPFTSSVSVVVNHNEGVYPIIQILDSSKAVIAPLSITHTSVNSFTVAFTLVTTGIVLYTGVPEPAVANGLYVSEDGSYYYTTEDGINYYEQE
jgi:hypothetical protein